MDRRGDGTADVENPGWKEGHSARERVRMIAETVTDPVSVNWVKEQADVGWQTAKDELEALAERGRVHRVTRDGGLRYVPDFTRQYTERIRELVLECSRAQLREAVVDIKEDIQAIESCYDVESRDDLEETLVDETLSAAQTRERKTALQRWEEHADELRLLEHALRLFDDLHDVDPYLSTDRPDAGGDRGEAMDAGAA